MAATLTTDNIETPSGLTQVTALADADVLIAQDVSESKLVGITKSDALAELVHKTGDETIAGVKTFGDIPVLAGGGIKFPATQVASSDVNTLDDYEEGTWTPVVYGGTTAGTGTYIQQSGLYIKLGALVYIQLYINLSAHTGSGDMLISGLPFTSGATPYAPAWFGRLNNLSFTSGYIPQTYIQHSTTYIVLSQIPAGGGSSIAIPLDGVCNFSLSGFYKVA